MQQRCLRNIRIARKCEKSETLNPNSQNMRSTSKTSIQFPKILDQMHSYGRKNEKPNNHIRKTSDLKNEPRKSIKVQGTKSTNDQNKRHKQNFQFLITDFKELLYQIQQKMPPTRQIHQKKAEIRSPKLRLQQHAIPSKWSIRFHEKKNPRIGGSDAKSENKNMKFGDWSTIPRNGMEREMAKERVWRFMKIQSLVLFYVSVFVSVRKIDFDVGHRRGDQWV